MLVMLPMTPVNSPPSEKKGEIKKTNNNNDALSLLPTNIGTNTPRTFSRRIDNHVGTPSTLELASNHKLIFISRLKSDISKRGVMHYIYSKLSGSRSNLEYIKYEKSCKTGSHIASFKVTIPSDLFKTVVSTSFWAPRTLVKEFISMGVNLPLTTAQLPNCNKSIGRIRQRHNNSITAPKNSNACPFIYYQNVRGL